MKKILLVAPLGGVPGGISRWTSHFLEYYNSLESKNCELNILSTARSMFVNINMPVWKRGWYAWKDYRKILRDFRHQVRKENYDVIHITSSGSLSLLKDMYMLEVAKRRGCKGIIHFHFGRIPSLAKNKNWEWKLLSRVCKRADKIVVLDNSSLETLKEYGFNNVELLPNPLAPEVETIINRNSELQRKKNTIIFAGHVVKTKGVFELLKACSTISGIKLNLIGHVTEGMRDEIEAIYGREHTWFTLCGEMPYEDVIKEMMQCDIFVLPTYTEGFPNVILEAMASGCAIITTPVGAIPQMLEEMDGMRYGVLVEPRDSEHLALAISTLITDEKFKSEMRKNVRQRVKERYNIQSVWKQLSGIWSTLAVV